MKNLHFLTACLFILLSTYSCSNSDTIDSCERTNWYGTYDKINEECDNGGSPLFEDIAFWKEGPCENCIADMSTTEYMINEDCRIVHITPLGWELVTELDGELLHVELAAFNCTATYQKRK